MLKNLFTLAAFGLSTLGYGQVTITPTFATQNDTVTITYDASQGNAALAGTSVVYAHTGVITNLSSNSNDWRYVQGAWGTDDSRMKMTNLGNNIHEIRYHINTFYSVPSGETVTELAFVFRDQSGNTVGRAADGSNINVPIYSSSFSAAITSPSTSNTIIDASDSVTIHGNASASAQLSIYVDGVLEASAANATTLDYEVQFSGLSQGLHEIAFTANNGSSTAGDTIEITSWAPGTPLAKPSWGEPGITWRNDSLYLELRAPNKPFVYVVGNFNDWKLDAPYEMNQAPDDTTFWIALDNLTPGQPISFQYHIGYDALRVADPYSTLVLDPWNDSWIADSTFPNLPEYPASFTTEPVSYTDPNAAEYQWDNSYVYERPNQEELVVYELLIRDFREGHTYASVIEKLDYLQDMGVNAIELMPIMEFEGNESWGYNPSFFFAPDKYYGPPNEVKRFVDSCHSRGIAVILDMVLNHAFGQNPLVRMYWDGTNNRPASNSPYFNPVAKHDYNVGYDFNHASKETRYYADRILTYWVEEFKADGYRMDLSKGFTQKNTLGDVSAWGQYDQTRVDILTHYAQTVWNVDTSLYFILEHFADNTEEAALSDAGMMLWANMNHEYNEATMGYGSNLYGATHKSRGWTDMHAVSFMESHDEERLMFRNMEYGAQNVNYSTRATDTALDRVALGATFFLTLPGPKMIWQFGEVGYDYSIEYNGRVGNKPIRWDYFQDAKRRALYDHFVELGKLRAQNDIFRNDGTWELSLNTYTKRIGLGNDTMKAIVLGNFNITTQNVDPQFSHTGMWYEYFTNDSLDVLSTDTVLTFAPGEYRIYSDVRFKAAPISPIDTTPPADTPTANVVDVYPTIIRSNGTTFYVENLQNDFIEIYIYDLNGQLIWGYELYGMRPGVREIDWNCNTTNGQPISNGVYVYRINRSGKTEEGKLVVQR